MEFHGVNGVESLSKENPSYENAMEAKKILALLDKLCEEKTDDEDFQLSSVCVVAFYPAQV